MNRPLILIKDNLLKPILATEERVNEICKESKRPINGVVLNGLFLMLVSYIESMQKELIKYFLKYRPDKFPDKFLKLEKTVLLDNEDFDLLEELITTYIDKMPYWRLSKIFYEALEIKKPHNEIKIQKIKDRRNSLIHNNLKVDFKKQKVQHDHINEDYLAESLNEYEKYLSELKSAISESYLKCSKLQALENLWLYTFRTPLCSNFLDYWIIDEQNDSLLGCKRPDIEKDLSSSEIFMLEIWRTQVCGGKVKFPNMASIDKHYQNCLYLFLKLSKDIFLYK
ncbi:hypothetical protein [Aquiflexum sp.]|uniref:hypothetical protein n=1 Tax=Aquiflexum sp. TaxID=1872584 RepID=UPI0035942538